MIRSAAALASPDAVGGPLGLRERMLEMAGVTEAEQAVVVRLAITKLVELTKAKRTQRLVVNVGLNTSEVQEFVDDDGALQARAASELLDRFGVVVSKAQASLTGGGDLVVHVHKVQPPAPATIVVNEAPSARPEADTSASTLTSYNR